MNTDQTREALRPVAAVSAAALLVALSGRGGTEEKRESAVPSKKLLGAPLFTAFRMHSADHQDATAMKHLITEYTNAAEKTDTCASGKPFPG
ncbi:hypothetical protein [Streptomyces misionensis]